MKSLSLRGKLALGCCVRLAVPPRYCFLGIRLPILLPKLNRNNYVTVDVDSMLWAGTSGTFDEVRVGLGVWGCLQELQNFKMHYKLERLQAEQLKILLLCNFMLVEQVC